MYLVDHDLVKHMVLKSGDLYSERLGIDVKSKDPEQLFKWMVACHLLAHKVPTNTAMQAYKLLDMRGLTYPHALYKASWTRLSQVLRSAGYEKLDFKVASDLLATVDQVRQWHDWDLNKMQERSRSYDGLVAHVQAFHGVSRNMAIMFLRDMRGVWRKTNLPLENAAIKGANRLGITKNQQTSPAMRDLKAYWKEHRVEGRDFRHFEMALYNYGRKTRDVTKGKIVPKKVVPVASKVSKASKKRSTKKSR